ncbi:MAG: flagellar basal body-associated FliL family protein [Armatimonadota bacterium]
MAEKAEKKEKAKGKGPLMFIVIAVLIAALVVGVAVITKKDSKPKPEKEYVEEGPTELIALGEFIVNLADVNETRYAKADIVIEVTGGEHKKGGGHGGGDDNSAENAKLRDAIISVLSKHTYEDLTTQKGKDDLKKEITDSLNERLGKRRIVDVYFNEFAMQ